MKKETLWMLIADLNNEMVPLAVPSVAWIAKEAGVKFECYLECERDGRLFAKTGSTVIGGHHHQQFNYLNNYFDVKYILLGETGVFASSIEIFGCELIAETEDINELYTILLNMNSDIKPESVMFISDKTAKSNEIDIVPYAYTEIFNRKALAYDADDYKTYKSSIDNLGIESFYGIYLDGPQEDMLGSQGVKIEMVDRINKDDTYGSLTVRIAERWKHVSKGVAFGDPDAIISQLPLLCEEKRLAIFGHKVPLDRKDVKVAAYTEEKSEITDDVIRLCTELDNRVIVGRQTGDGDIFEFSKGGVCIQIMDPNRPAFPAVKYAKHIWNKSEIGIFDEEPDDSMLEKYADEGKLLATLMFHSGEMAHNEAMINLFELSIFTGAKLGIGTHIARYQTCPQMWELLNVSKEKGGVRGLIEPVIHSGGMGVMAEINCPPDILQKHCATALDAIREIAGEKAMPKGYYAFADTDLETMSHVNPEIYKAIEKAGLEYFISSVKPGRNKIIYDSEGFVTYNQTSKTQCVGSPFARITTIEDVHESGYTQSPGWFIGTLDSPVISFNPYIWRHGSRFMKIIDWMVNSKNVVNVLPHTISRYAKILKKKGYIN